MSLTTNGVSLVDIPIFSDIPPDAVKALCARGRVASFDAGHLLFERRQDATELMILQDGIVELLFPVSVLGATREVAMESKRPGDVVAWSALVSPYHFTLSARCASHCTLTCLTREAIHLYFDTDPMTGYRFMNNLAGVIGRRLQAMQTTWMHDLQASLAKRLE
ncbi:MAG: Crp/Fnr family transcriptional regulator [Phycisphaerae bacterium]